jgi:hypothetical protein
MAATSIFFDGKLYTKPGSYSKVDVSGLESTGLGASGVVAVLGTAVGGLPVASITKAGDIPRYSRVEAMRSAFRSGQLREVAGMLFEPAKDADILGGAQEVLALKVNPALQSSLNLAKSSVNQILLTSKDYGEFTNQINVELATGTNKGKKLTIRFEDFLEVGDDIGGDSLATLQYIPGSSGWTTALATLATTGDLTVNATRTSTGKIAEILNANGAAVEIVSASAGDTTQVATVFGQIGGVAVRVQVTLNGTNAVSVPGVWDAGTIFGVRLSAITAGNLTLRTVASTTIATVVAGTLVMGNVITDYCYVNRTNVSTVLDGAGTTVVYIWGKDAAGAVIGTKITTNGTTPVPTVGMAYAEVTDLVLGSVAGARTMTVSAEAAKSIGTTQTTLQKAKDYFNAKQVIIAGPATRGFVFTILTGEKTYAMASLDMFTSQSILTALSIKADLDALIRWINSNSQFIGATRVSGATGVPDNLTPPSFLTGGSEGSALFANYQAALDLLKKVRVNTIVDLSGDPAVAAALDAHCAFMAGQGKSERDGVSGILNGAANNVPTKTEIKAAVIAVNSRHMRLVGQAVERFNSAGEKQEFLPPYTAAIIAGMQAGTTVGTPLTNKYLNVLGLRQDSSWNPVDDAEEMIKAGLLFAEEIDGKGRRVVRNITTHLTTSNIAFVEASVNQAVNFAVFEFRNTMEYAVGRKGFSGTIGVTKSLAKTKLGLLVDEEIITGWRSLDIEITLDVMDVNVELAPVIPINFVRSTIHLVTMAQLAAASAR